MADASQWVQAWEDEHPAVAVLQSQPGRWAIVDMDVYIECKRLRHPNLEFRSTLEYEGAKPKVRWVPDRVVVAMQLLNQGASTQPGSDTP